MRYTIDNMTEVTYIQLPHTVQTAWYLLNTLSKVNKIGIDTRLPQHLIPQEYHESFSTVVLQWLGLSKHLAVLEFEKDVEEEVFEAEYHLEGHGRSATGASDLMKAMMDRVEGVKWPGGVGPGASTLTTMAQQLVEMVHTYTHTLTHAFTLRGHTTNTISTQACVVIRSMEYVCAEVKTHIQTLATKTTNGDLKHQLEDRTLHLQEYVDDGAEIILRQCLPNVENLLTNSNKRNNDNSGNSDDDSVNWQHLIAQLELIVAPSMENLLYFAEPLLQQLWFRLFTHAKHLMDIYIKGEWRDRLRELRILLEHTHTFLTSPDSVGLVLPQVVQEEYNTVLSDLHIVGATSTQLMCQFYNERYNEQQRQQQQQQDNNTLVIIVNACYTDTGLRLHIVQGPGGGIGGSSNSGVLVKVRLEPQQYFPTCQPRKTRIIKDNPPVFNEVMEFPGVFGGYGNTDEGGEGVVTMQLRTPRLFSSATVHFEAVLPLADIPTTTHDQVLQLQHTHLTLTRPWKLSSYKPLEALSIQAPGGADESCPGQISRGVSEGAE
ncbi:hypothetical protein Pmani_024353 [Petrolisthes manimaculis]|uniref:MHD1 domain-containing protein n=1 Tax=Petrolisthes manimaculis TaxID=1843537 RepID=A0AAE1TZG4_9EUCA|nr:hypothetical protein Pmani_024353 [Petrolisthes manimaculis]